MAIRYEIHDATVMITIDRAEAINALDQEHNDQLTEAFARYEADPALRVAVLTGAGEKAFCAGAWPPAGSCPHSSTLRRPTVGDWSTGWCRSGSSGTQR